MISLLKESPISSISFKDIEGNILPNISMSLIEKDSKIIDQISYTGNLIVYNNNNIEFIFENSKTPSNYKEGLFDECKLFFILASNCYECDADVKATSGNKIYLKNLSFNVLDDFFSLPWTGEVFIGFEENLFIKLEILLLGANRVILKIDNDTFSKVKGNLDENAVLYINEVLEEIELKEAISISFNRVYKISEGVIIIADYVEIMESQRDRILKILFKKQALTNKKRYNAEI